MKSKLYLLFVLALTLGACGREAPMEIRLNPVYRFDITVTSAGNSATKGVKTDWESGDVIYVFFEDNSLQYLKMTFNGTTWDLADKQGGAAFEGLNLTASGKKVSAVWFPPYVNDGAPDWSEQGGFVFPNAKEGGYFMSAESVPYTMEAENGVQNVCAQLDMKAPEGFVQFYVADDDPLPDTWWLTEANFACAGFEMLVPGESVNWSTGTYGFPLPGLPATVDGEKGYYFYGVLRERSRGVADDYTFQMVRQGQREGHSYVSAVKGKASVTATMYVVDGGAVSKAAFKLGGWQDRHFVDMGTGDVLWGIGNLQEDSPYIADPLQPGNWYMWGNTAPYHSGAYYGGAYDVTSTDPAYAKNSSWRLPTREEYTKLYNSATWTWVTKDSGDKQAGVYLVTSRKNGLSLVLLTSGYYFDGRKEMESYVGAFWSSGEASTADLAYSLSIYGRHPDFNNLFTGPTVAYDGTLYRRMGASVRPVMEIKRGLNPIDSFAPAPDPLAL